MRIVITGASGNIGTSLVERLVQDDRVESIVGLARRRPPWSAPGLRWVPADVTRDDLVPHFKGADAVVHLAWLFQPSHRPLITWATNVVGSERVFAAVADAGVESLIYASSVGAYSPGPGDRPVDETWPTNSVPTAAYGREKAYVERLLDTFEARHPGVRVVRFRPAFMFKRGSASEQRRLFAGPWVPRRATEYGRLPFLPLPSGLRFQALHSADAADAYCRGVFSDVAGVFNLAAEPVVDAAALADLLGTQVVEVPRPFVRAAVGLAWRAHLTPAEPALLDLAQRLPLMDSAKARAELGWEPRYSATEALAEMLEGMSSGAGLPTPPLEPDTPLRRVQEVATGVGQRP